jgi:periplasmic protein TonB
MEEKKNKIRGIVGTIVFHVAILIALLLLALRTPLPLPGEEGVEVSLGYAETGSGLTQPEEVKPVQEVQPVTPEPEPKEIITQEIEETPLIEEVIPDETIEPEEEIEEVIEPLKEEPVVNPDALYTPHKTDKDESGTEGDRDELLDRGKETGTADSKKPDGVTGMGEGVSFNLEGRGSIHLPKPAYESQEQGRVVVRIWVNKQGKVVRVQSGVQGTTITDQRLTKLAEDAARNASFTPDPNAPDQQVGTITYNFIRRN